MAGNTAATPPLLPPGGLQTQASHVLSEATFWFQGNWLQILGAIAFGIAAFVVLRLLRGWGLKLCQRGGGAATWYSILGRAVAKTGNLFIVIVSARLVIGFADAPPILRSVVTFLFTIIAAFQAAIWVREIVFGAVEHRTLDEHYQGQALSSAIGIIRLLVSIAVFAIALVVVLSNLGVNVTGLVAGLGVGGIAIGLAAQGIFADLFAALAILFDKPFRLGDSVSYDKGAGSGTVEAIGLKSTRIRGGNGEQRIIANRKLLDWEILNTTRRVHNRFKFDFSIGYATPPEVVSRMPELLQAAVEKEGYKLIHGGLNSFGASGLNYDVEFESIDADFPAGARDRVAAAILETFRDHDVSFAYPTQVNLLAEKTKPTPPAGQAHAEDASAATA
jgi:small-conductance mechanosensitive channel